MPPERVLVVIDGMEVGGSQAQVVQLLRGLDRQRWAPELAFFRDDSTLADAVRRDGTPVHLVPKRRRFDPSFLRAYARLLRERDYALVHAFSLTAELASVMAFPLARRRPALVVSERSFALDRPSWFWRLKRLVLERADAAIANSRAGATATALRTRMPEASLSVIANAVDLPMAITPAERDDLRRELGVPAGRRLALFVGRLVYQKNLPCLLGALAQLPPPARPWLAIAGDGPERAALERLASELGLDADVRLLGERGDAKRLMQAADLLVLPSFFEGLSNSLLEAMAAGCPVVASAVGGTPELVEDGRTGLLFPADDVAALAAAILRLAGDPALGARLSRAGRDQVVRNHSREALAAAVSAIYERCLQARGAAGTAPAEAAGATPDPACEGR
jgi:glycosyltransferase involved in cell wall biosynthesis